VVPKLGESWLLVGADDFYFLLSLVYLVRGQKIIPGFDFSLPWCRQCLFFIDGLQYPSHCQPTEVVWWCGDQANKEGGEIKQLLVQKHCPLIIPEPGRTTTLASLWLWLFAAGGCKFVCLNLLTIYTGEIPQAQSIDPHTKVKIPHSGLC